MPIFKVENEFNNQLTLTQNEDKWQLISVTGLNQPNANVVTSVIPTFDGSRFNSSRLENRNIVITLALKGNVETNRMILNNVILSKRYIKVYYQNNTLDVYCEGYVESFEYDVFEQGIRAQISIICTDPYWIDTNSNVTNLSAIINLFEFPFSVPEEGIALSEQLNTVTNVVHNLGTVQTGAVITLTCSHNVLNPSIMNLTTGQTMLINQELMPGDQIVISTIRRKKYIQMYSDGTTSNIINDLDESSEWITLAPGDNTFAIAADYGLESLQVTIAIQNLYGGV